MCDGATGFVPDNFKIVEKLETDELDESLINEDRSWFNHECHRVHNTCDISYTFRLFYNPTATEAAPSYEFIATKFAELCPQKVDLVIVGSSAFGTVILIGLFTIIGFKIATEYLDHREYQRFIREVDAANFSAVSMDNVSIIDVLT